mgnify:CR=1 FL=1
MEKIAFIVNPVAGGGKTRNLIPLINKKMQEKNVNYEIMMTKRPKEAVNIAK